jgi:hypothetical protein
MKPGFYIGPAFNSYCCFKLVKSGTKSQVISDTIKFCCLYLSVIMPSTKDKIIHALQVVTGTIPGAPPPTSVSSSKLSHLFRKSLSHGVRLLPHP